MTSLTYLIDSPFSLMYPDMYAWELFLEDVWVLLQIASQLVIAVQAPSIAVAPLCALHQAENATTLVRCKHNLVLPGLQGPSIVLQLLASATTPTALGNKLPKQEESDMSRLSSSVALLNSKHQQSSIANLTVAIAATSCKSAGRSCSSSLDCCGSLLCTSAGICSSGITFWLTWWALWGTVCCTNIISLWVCQALHRLD